MGLSPSNIKLREKNPSNLFFLTGDSINSFVGDALLLVCFFYGEATGIKAFSLLDLLILVGELIDLTINYYLLLNIKFINL